MDGKRILTVGMARSGIAAAELLHSLGACPILSDTKPEEAFGDQLEHLRELGCEFRLGEDQVALVEECDGVVLSPGVPLKAPVVTAALAKGLPLIGELELAATVLPGELYAISGTNGKTTTTTLLGEILKAAGKESHVAGNIGYPLSLVALEAGEEACTVAEVSSFQLETIQTFHPHVAALLNITEDHLNRHGTMQEYIRLKARLFENQLEQDYAVLNLEDEILRGIAPTLKSRVLYFSRLHQVEQGTFVRDGKIYWTLDGIEEEICEADQILIPGPHNLENALAAAAMARAAGIDASFIRETLYTFRGVEHRIETVRTLDGITYINDSKGTNVDSTIKAVESMKVPTVIILGGYDKHTDFSPLCRLIKANPLIVHGVIIGQTGPQIARQLREEGYEAITFAADMKDAVEKSRSLTAPGGNVLLSPACASFDMFQDYEQRGEIFKQIVMELE